MTPPNPSRPSKEDIARIIDPDAWNDPFLEDDMTPTEREIYAERRGPRKRKALAKAEAILALLPAPHIAGGWQDINNPPQDESPSGRWIVAHRGYAIIDYYFSPRKEWAQGAKFGWQGDHSFGPTHYCALPDLAIPPAPDGDAK